MKIAVCVKTATGAAVSAEDAFLRNGRVGAGVLAPHDMHAVEEALRIVERAGAGEVVAVAVTPAESLGALRTALALGAHRAVMLSDPLLDGCDLLATSRALAALLARERADLCLTCTWSGDIDGTMLWAATAERLGRPALTQARSLVLAGGEAICQRQVEAGDITLAAALPCMVEVTETINRPRYPTLKGQQEARRKRVELLRLADLGLAPETVGEPGAATALAGLDTPPPRRAATVIEDVAAAPDRIVEFLAARRLL